ncbi:hypothetical protein CROQUDRAFT_667612 [Cronartium quercuum f. sp. fusiforme G11]|uniref:Leucine-rich repeat-containing protein 40 n=1 Tax=Cronartium quercuum f. sp. fusiforme G11 TaxID=708437 RepID=A0A9P6TGL9_9BASI|nr:hypothetical protein CROQUDRAFT_667612 [Cronartium quercuum f. sp. fusiforme G11]
MTTLTENGKERPTSLKSNQSRLPVLSNRLTSTSSKSRPPLPSLPVGLPSPSSPTSYASQPHTPSSKPSSSSSARRASKSPATSPQHPRSPLPRQMPKKTGQQEQEQQKTLKRPKSSHSIPKPKTMTDSPLPARSTTSMTNRSTTSMTNRTNPSPIPKTPVKSSEAFREMLASARRNAKKAGQSPRPVDQRTGGEDQTFSAEWGFQPLEKVIEKAQRTGRLNLGSRMINQLPSSIYSQLIPSHSVFHPSNRIPVLSFQAPSKAVDLSLPQADDEEANEGVKWYEILDLTYLNASMNDIEIIEDEIGGFESLEHCDLHHNKLANLPNSFGLLVNLVYLNLSSNKLQSFPLPILALVNLRELDLSNNALSKLWDVGWKPALKQALATVVRPVKADESGAEDQSFEESFDGSLRTGRGRPSMMSNSSVGNEDFSDFFPSSPTKRAAARERALIEKDSNSIHSVPFPSLHKFVLSSNAFSSQSLFGPQAPLLPPSLVELDVSKNALREPIDVAGSLVGLDQLSRIVLSGCEFGDSVFRFEIEEERDQLQDESPRLFESLKSLDLSHNGIDSLGPLEGFFGQHVPGRRLVYRGVPARLAKIVQGQTLTGAPNEVEVSVTENFLRDEGRRRRAMASTVVQPVSPPSVPTEALQTLTLNPSPELTILTEITPQPSPPTAPAVVVPQPNESDRIWQMIEAAYAKPTHTLSLPNHALSTFSLANPPADLPPIRTLDVSLNKLSTLPLALLHPETLTTLNLSRNKLPTAALSLAPHLPALEDLNLASNTLTSEGLFVAIEALAGSKLRALDLSSNMLTSDEGLEGVILGKSLQKLVLHSNRINSLATLERLASSLSGWTCKEIDLSDNDLAKLEPVLGCLPLEILFVSGNAFRVPVRKVYEGADGSGRLLKWLKERYVG